MDGSSLLGSNSGGRPGSLQDGGGACILPNSYAEDSHAARRERQPSIADMSHKAEDYKLTQSGVRGWKIFKMMAAAEIVMFETLDNKEIHARLAAQWGSVGIISALLGGIAWAEVTNKPDGITEGMWTSIYGMVSCFAAACNVFSSLVCMLFFMALNTGPEETARSFIDYFLLVLPLPLLLLVVRCEQHQGRRQRPPALVLCSFPTHPSLFFSLPYPPPTHACRSLLRDQAE